MGQLVGSALGAIGGILGGNKAADAQRAQAENLRQSGQQAFDASRFRPVGITTRFGSSAFNVDPTTGALLGANYSLSPEYANIQDRLMAQAAGQGMDFTGQGLQGAQSLFNLGQGYLAETPQQAAQNWMANQQALLAPSRAKAAAGLTQNLFNTGRGGVAVSQGTGMGAANTEQQALLNAQAQQDLQLAAEAQQQGMNQTKFGASLFGMGSQVANAGYDPFKTQFGLMQNIEQAGQQPLTLGMDIGKTASGINAQAAGLRLNPQTSAAGIQAKADSWSPWASALTSMGSSMGNWSNPFSSAPPMTAASSTGGWGTGDYFGNQDLGAYL